MDMDFHPSSLKITMNYYDDSFRMIRDAGLNLVRYLYYWEAYEMNPELFIRELQTVARVADKYGIKVIYDNNQVAYRVPNQEITTI
jgi:aryl-phospho-beta-D-glucosidase BglC (GH1 family)